MHVFGSSHTRGQGLLARRQRGPRPGRRPASAHQAELQAVAGGHGPCHRLQELRGEPVRPGSRGGGAAGRAGRPAGPAAPCARAAPAPPAPPAMAPTPPPAPLPPPPRGSAPPSRPASTKGKRPAWELTEDEAEQREDQEEDNLLDFVLGLDIDEFLTDLDDKEREEASRIISDLQENERRAAAAEAEAASEAGEGGAAAAAAWNQHFVTAVNAVAGRDLLEQLKLGKARRTDPDAQSAMSRASTASRATEASDLKARLGADKREEVEAAARAAARAAPKRGSSCRRPPRTTWLRKPSSGSPARPWGRSRASATCTRPRRCAR